MTSLYRPTAAEIAAAAESMIVAFTADSARIARARQLIDAGAVEYVSAGIGWTVQSQRSLRRQDPEDPEPQTYLVSSTSCGCMDHLARHAARGQCGSEIVTIGAGCKHIYAVQMYLRIIAGKLDAALRERDGQVYGVEMRHNLYGVYDRQDDERAICGAVYIVKSDSYRPETSQDAADFARWLAAQPVATEPRQWFAGGLLEEVLRQAPDKLTLRADVVYGKTRTYRLAGYRYDGAAWVHLAYADRQPFNETAWNAVLASCGFIQPGRPVKQNGLAYHYMLERGTPEQAHYALSAAAGEYAERRPLRRMFDNDMSAGQL